VILNKFYDVAISKYVKLGLHDAQNKSRTVNSKDELLVNLNSSHNYLRER